MRARMPSAAAWNIQYLSLSKSAKQKKQHRRKLECVKCLCRQFDILGVSETHVDEARARIFFFDHCVISTESLTFYERGMAIVVKKQFAEKSKVEKVHVLAAEPGVCFGVSWQLGEGEGKGWFLLLHLSAESKPAEKIRQLKEIAAWAREMLGPQDLVMFAGDRNFVKHQNERMSSRESEWRPSPSLQAAWQELERATRTETLKQPDWTWRRVGRKQEEEDAGRGLRPEDEERRHGEFQYAILDVAGAPEESCDPMFRPTAQRVDLPWRVSDHHPIACRWVKVRSRGGGRKPREAGSEPILRKRLPEWLFRDEGWLHHITQEVADWQQGRSKGHEGLVQFTELVYSRAVEYLRNYVVQAKTAEHKLEAATALIKHVECRMQKQRSGSTSAAEDTGSEARRPSVASSQRRRTERWDEPPRGHEASARGTPPPADTRRAAAR